MKDKPKYFSRYYFSYSRVQACYKINDRKLHIHIATCQYREAAALLARALNLEDGIGKDRVGFAEGTVD
jgi:hypothetical protein